MCSFSYSHSFLKRPERLSVRAGDIPPPFCYASLCHRDIIYDLTLRIGDNLLKLCVDILLRAEG